MSISIRALAQPDYADWHRLWTGYLAYYERSLSDDAKRNAFDRLLDPATHVNGLLALQNDHPVGLVHFIYHDHMWRPEGVCYLQDLFTDPAARGTGVGRTLIESVYAAAAEAGKPYVYWLTQDFNETARKLYDRVGEVTPFIKYQCP